MKVSAITTTLQKPAKKILPFVAGAITLVGCQSVSTKIRDYCINEEKTQVEYKKIEPTQRALDSLVYRDIFNSTTLAKDSVAIAEFNEIAKKPDKDAWDARHKKLLDSGISAKDYNNMYLTDSKRFVYDYDKYMYTKFFQEHGLMPQVVDRLEKAYNFLAPHMAYTYYETLAQFLHQKTERNLVNITCTGTDGIEKNIININVRENK